MAGQVLNLLSPSLLTPSHPPHASCRPPPPQFRCDEKGFLAICAFGLPGRTHEDGPARGIQAALAIVEAVKVRAGLLCLLCPT